MRSRPSIVQLRIDAGADLLDGLHQGAQALERVVLALHRDHHGIRGHQRIQREHVERRRTVDQNHVEILAHRLQRIAQLEFASRNHAEQPDLGGRQILIGRHQHEAAVLDRHQRFHGGAIAQHHLATGARLRVLVDAASHGGIALRIEVDQQHAPFGRRQRGSKIDGGRGLSDAAFLICDCDDPLHVRNLTRFGPDR